jgi:general secretion pathway protein M
MRESAFAWWQARTSREQLLLAVMLGLLGLLIAWLLVVRPLADALEGARLDHAEAVTSLGEARARAAASRQAQGGQEGAAPLPIDAFVSRTAAQAGFAGARVTGQGPARASIAIDAARPQAFFGWTAEMERSGLVVETLTARANADRTLAIEAAFRARPSRGSGS